MRDAKSKDYWSAAYKRRYNSNLQEIDFNGLNKLPAFSFPKGILAICGLNGAGKSTIVSGIKDVIGLPLSDQDKHRINSQAITCKANLNGIHVECANRSGERLVDLGLEASKAVFIDSTDSIAVQQFIVHQANLDELLEQYEEYELPEKSVEEVNYLVGKRYSACSIRELEDVDGSGSTIPYFSVVVDGEQYDTKGMGYGEHFILYLYWRIHSIVNDTLLIIEEPETFISILSQINFANYLGEQMAQKGIMVILTTHSPYILNNIKNENVIIVSRLGTSVSILSPDENLSAEHLLGLNNAGVGTFFVEDKVASDFLQTVLEDRCPQLLRSFTIEQVGGEAEITKRLAFPFSEEIKYKFVGIYDGDMRESINQSELHWKYCFLPGDKALEDVFRDCLHHESNLDNFCAYIEKDKGQVIAMLAKIDGLDYHDWFNEFRKLLGVDGKKLVASFYHTMIRERKNVDAFIDELRETIS